MANYERTPDQVGLKLSWTRDHLCVLDDDDVVHLLRAAVKREGSQAAFAKRFGLDRGTMNSILKWQKTRKCHRSKGFRASQSLRDRRLRGCLSGLEVSNLSRDGSGR